MVLKLCHGLHSLDYLATIEWDVWFIPYDPWDIDLHQQLGKTVIRSVVSSFSHVC